MQGTAQKIVQLLRLVTLLFLSLGLISSSSQNSQEVHKLCHGFVPENDLKIPVGRELVGGLSEAVYNKVIDKVSQVYTPIVAHYGGQLSIQKLWNDGTVNAYAERQGSLFVVKMMGGLARHPAMTADGLTLVACHEVGHHIGGVPRYAGQWAGSEGQSDYFATLKCMRHVFMNEDNQSIVRELNVPSSVEQKCRRLFSTDSDYFICQRSAMAGQSGANLFASLSGVQTPNFETPDASVVSSSYEKHPAAQCRLDTYYQGSICGVDEDTEIGQNDPNTGTCNRPHGDTEGIRPLCWYKPSGGGTPDPGTPGGEPLAPLIQGQTQFKSTNPNAMLGLLIDVTPVSGAQGFLLEASKPGTTFSNPGGNTPDPVNGLGYQAVRGTRGIFNLLPINQLPGWGVYQFRTLALDGQGRGIGHFSQAVTLILMPN